jgi:DNA topoisomerase-1
MPPKSTTSRARSAERAPTATEGRPPLVVVESPTKARTIRAFLPKNYRVAASMGHVRDLPESAAEIPPSLKKKPWARLGVNVERDFEPLYVVPAAKRKVVRELKKLLDGAGRLIIATDEDREGESIGWHLVQVLGAAGKVPIERIVFHEITADAIRRALESPRGIDEHLVQAQETRRILDRLVGYELSPLLWKKIATRLSAGRVQSVAVRMLVDRERERRAFRSATYWDLTAELEKPGAPPAFAATLVEVDGQRVATGRDFDAQGQPRPGVRVLDEAAAHALAERLREVEWRVEAVDEKRVTRRPPLPFTTSTLQQEANRKLRWSAQQTMRVAQRLYEQGYITYMRTDSVHLAAEAVDAIRGAIAARYGREFLPARPRHYKTKTRGAQEAHEAIRPAGTEMKTAQELGLSGPEAALYDLIWKRTVACQMAEAQLVQATATIVAGDARFRATGRRIAFPGFFRAYVEGSDDPDAALEDREEPLPPLAAGDALALRDLQPQAHRTEPPPRYTDASLVKALEEKGIGRPSTYATIIDTIVQRGYAERRRNQLVPTFVAFAVTELLERHFPELVDTEFTARMEEVLDEIARGRADRLAYLRRFYFGEGGLKAQVERGEATIDPREASTIVLPDLPQVRVRIGRHGPYLEAERNGTVLRASLPENLPPADLTPERAEELLAQAGSEGSRLLGHDAEGRPVYVLRGPFGPYLQRGDGRKPERVSLPPGWDPATVTLERALALLALPRELGRHPETGETVRVGVGRYGPYVAVGDRYVGLPPDRDPLAVTLEEAVALLAAGRRAVAPLRVLGPHPQTGQEVAVYRGRYGPYVKHGSVNATLPRGVDPQAITLEEALELLAAKEARGPTAARRTTRKTRG